MKVFSVCKTRSSVQFGLVQDCIYALGKAHIRSTPSLGSFPKCCLWNDSNVRLTDNDPLSSFQGRSSSACSLNASFLQAIDGVMSLALCRQVVSQNTETPFNRFCFYLLCPLRRPERVLEAQAWGKSSPRDLVSPSCSLAASAAISPT